MIIKEFDLEDVFIMSEIIDKMGIEADVDKITKSIKTAKIENKKDVSSLGKEVVVGIGIDLVTKLIRNLHKARKEVFKLIADLTGLKEEEVKRFTIKQLTAFFTELISGEGFKDFLSQAEQ